MGQASSKLGGFRTPEVGTRGIDGRLCAVKASWPRSCSRAQPLTAPERPDGPERHRFTDGLGVSQAHRARLDIERVPCKCCAGLRPGQVRRACPLAPRPAAAHAVLWPGHTWHPPMGRAWMGSPVCA